MERVRLSAEMPPRQRDWEEEVKNRMYAVVETGGKQYKVAVDQKFSVEYLATAEPGSTVTLPCLLFSNDNQTLIGKDADKVKVEAKVLQHGKGKKLNIFTYKAKKNVRKRQGHRQPYTELQVTKISAGK